MPDTRIIELKQSVFADNDREADRLRRTLRSSGTFLVNLMSSPGAGKTTTLLRTVRALEPDLRAAVMEADIDSAVDAELLQAAGIRAVQLHTGGMCHLDAGMTAQGLAALDTAALDVVFLENIGNLVCPAEFDTGAAANVMILSVPEGHDKPLKYPLMFQVCDVLLVNKMDALSCFDFDLEQLRTYALRRNPALQIFPVSAKTGDGFDDWLRWLRENAARWKRG